MSNIATKSNVSWDKPNRSVTDVSDDDAADALGRGSHPKQNTPPTHEAQVLPGSPGSGAAPGANGPPTTGGISPGGPLGSF